MTQNNIYMEDDGKGISVDVEPLFLDVLTQNKNIAMECANIAQECEQSVNNILENVINTKTNIELFCAQTTNRLTELHNEFRTATINMQNNILDNINTLTSQNINSIQANVQAAINQLQTYVEQVDNTVNDNISLDYLNQSKALETGNISTNSKVLPYIKKLAHSTFDKSKFTVVGSPVITDDGIASGLGSYNYIYVNNFSCPNRFVFKGKFKPTTTTLAQQLFNIGGDAYHPPLGLGCVAGRRYQLFITSDNTNIASFYDSIDYCVTLNVWNYYKFSYDGSVYKLETSTDDKNYTTVATITSSEAPKNTAGKLAIGSIISDRAYNNFEGEIDLKQFSITVDGAPVFSGNKTGIDTIKPSNFTVVTGSMKAFVYDTHTIYADSDSAPTRLYNADGTLHPQSSSEWQIVGTTVKYNGNAATYTSGSNITSIANPPLPFNAGLKITEDGVASGFGSSNYLYTPLIDFSKPFIIKGKLLPLSYSGTNKTFIGMYNNKHSIIFQINTEAGLSLWLSSDGTSWDIANGARSNNYILTMNTNYFFKLEFTGSKYIASYSIDDENYIVAVQVDSITNLYNSALGIGGNKADIVYQPLNGSIDLNAFKIYVDGDLAYQPCLKIPYTESLPKYGSKIVNAVYRKRVEDSWEQGFTQRYFTLDESAGNFELPKGDIYGMIEQLRLMIENIE